MSELDIIWTFYWTFSHAFMGYPFLPEEELSPEERKELEELKREVEQGECVPLEEVLKKYGTKKGLSTRWCFLNGLSSFWTV